jgi:hypothetical protein
MAPVSVIWYRWHNKKQEAGRRKEKTKVKGRGRTVAIFMMLRISWRINGPESKQA